jgi:hypothetical protein
MISRIVLPSCLALLMLVGNSVYAQWSTIKGKFTVLGDVPVLQPLVCGGAAGGPCCAKPVPDESVVVSQQNELANVFVYVRGQVANINPPIKAAAKPLVLDNVGCIFKPHASILWTEQKLEINNKDNVGHNTNYGSALQGFNVLIPAGGQDVRQLQQGENLPQNISCNIHPWMQAKLLVRDNPYFAVSAADGTFEIKDVPNNALLEYQLWHEKTGYLGNLKFEGGVVDAKGRFKLTAAKNTDLGEIKVDAKVLK